MTATTPTTNGTEIQNGEKKEEEPSKQKLGEFTVFVAKLSAKVTADVLKSHFKSAGEVLHVNIPRKVLKENKRHGIAFIDFANKEGYEAALKMDQSLLEEQPILVLPASQTHQGLIMMEEEDEEEEDEEAAKEEEAEKEKEGYVPVYKKSEHVAYIKGLPHGATEEEVLKFFDKTREDIVDIIILRRFSMAFKGKKRGKRPIRAIIAFKTAEDLQKALDMSKKKLNDHEVVVEKHVMMPRPEKRPAEDNSGESAEKRAKTGDMTLDLFVKHIPKEATERQIRDFFLCAGAIVQTVSLFTDNVSGVSKGMGFITMKNKDSWQKGLLLDNKRFFKSKVRVTIPRDHPDREKPDKGIAENNFSTFISNLSIKEKPEAVKQVLSNFFKKKDCKVKLLRVPHAPNRFTNRGYAFVVFEDEDSLKKCQGLGNFEVYINNNKYITTMTDRWPESPGDAAEWARQQEQRFAGRNMQPRRGGPIPLHMIAPFGPDGPYGPGGPGGPYGPSGPGGPYGPSGPGGPMPNDFHGPPGPWEPMRDGNFREPFGAGGPPRDGPFMRDVPPDYQTAADYQDYLDYLDYRDYVAMRNERREAEIRNERREAEFRRLREQEEALAMGPGGPGRPVPPARPMNDGGPPIMDEGYGGRGPERTEERFRGGGGFADDYRRPDRIDERRDFDRPLGQRDLSTIGSRRETRDYPDVLPPRAERDGYPGERTSSGGPGAFGGGGSNAPPKPYRDGGGSYGGGGFSDSFSSMSSNRYQTANDSTLSRSKILDSSSRDLRRDRSESGSFRDAGPGESRSFSFGQSGFSGGSNSDLRRPSDRDSKFGPMGYSDRGSSGYSGEKFGSGFGTGSGSRDFANSPGGGGDFTRRYSSSGTGGGSGGNSQMDRRYGGPAMDKPNLGMISKSAVSSSDYYRKY